MADLPSSNTTTLATLRTQLDADPEGTLARARAAWDNHLTEAQLRSAIDAAEADLRAGREPAPLATRGRPTVIPSEFTFPGYDPGQVPLNVDTTKFETWADAPGWVLYTGPAIIGNLLADRAPFRRHSEAVPFHDVHRTPEPERPVKIGLVSDFGTGLAHSRYIAKHLANGSCEMAIHLGDVYYAGRAGEFANYFDGPLEPVFENMPFYGLPGNHEFYSGGHSYFQSIDKRRERYPAKQSQIGSYFSLRFGDLFQIIGIDGDYFGHARYEDAELRAWLGTKLSHGRDLGCVNILLSGNELHTYGKPGKTALFNDIEPFLPSVDLMFWGNDHYCAFFDRTERLPLTGCIGHGGYPYHLKEYGLNDPTSAARSAAPVVYAETGGRYPQWTGMRPELGNNGFCEMTLNADQSVSLLYRDWMARDRAKIVLGKDAGGTLVVRSSESW